MIWRVRDRGTFEALRRRGRRTRRGPVTVTYVPAEVGGDAAAGQAARVAFAISRRVGNAVVRNRLRRRMRSIMTSLDRSEQGLAPGAYLLSVRPEAAELSHAQLAELVAAACAAGGTRPVEEPAR
jgi:ribonuclease P protein component